MSPRWRVAGLLGMGLVAGPLTAGAQETAFLRATGRLSAWGELHDRSGGGTPARPAQTGRVQANLTLDLGGLISVPLHAIISSDQVSFRQQINQLGISPRYKWAQAHGGYFTPRYSAYSLADNTLMGGGVDLSPGILRLGVVTGRSQRAITPGLPWVIPAFERHVLAGRVGLEDGHRGAIGVAWMRSEEDAASLAAFRDSLLITPGRNEVIAASGELRMATRRLVLAVEGARSSTVPDLAIPTESFIGWAGSVRLAWNQQRWSLGGTMEWLDEGFVTWGNQQLGSDRLDLGVTGRLATLGGRFNLSGMAGHRRENLSRTQDAITTRGIYNLTADLQATSAFGVAVTMANNQNNSRATEGDTALIRHVTAQYSVTPRLILRTGRVTHVVVAMGMLQESDQASGNAALSDTRVSTGLVSWVASLPGGLSLLANGTRTMVTVDTLETVVEALSPGFSMTAVGGRLHLSAQAQFTRTRTGTLPGTSEAHPLLELRWQLDATQAVALRSGIRRVDQGPAAGADHRFTERTVRLEYTATLRR